MNLKGEFLFDGHRAEVWDLLRDPSALASALPGTQNLDLTGENEYSGKMNIRVGPVSGLFSGKLTISNEVPPESYTMVVEGRGAAGHVKGTGHVQLIEQENNKTLLRYTGEFQPGGKIANVGQRMLDSVAKSMVKQGLETLNQSLIAKLQPAVSASKVKEQTQPVFTPPSEMEFALGVAKNMLEDVITPENRPIIIAIIAGITGFLLGFLLGKSSR